MASTDMQVTVKLVDQMSKQMMLLQRQVASLDGGISKAGKNANLATSSFSKLGTSFSSAASKAAKIGLVLGAATAGMGVQMLKSAASMETMGVALKTSFQGNEAEAKAAQATITEFAASTPYQLEEVMTGFIKLKNMGLDPSKEALTAYGDTASAMGKSLNDMVEAVADAATGEFERLKEFGIRSAVEGDKVKFTFQGVTTEVGNNAQEIEGYLKNLGKEKFGGGMEAQSKTLGGVISTFKDTVSLAFADIAEKSGLLQAAKDMFNSLSTFIANNKDKIIELSAALGSGIITNFNLLKDAMFQVYEKSQQLFLFLQNNQWVLPIVAGAITGLLVPAFFAWAAAAGAAAASTLLAAAPFMIVGALIGAFAYMVIKNWDSIKLGAQLLWAGIKAMFSAGVGFLKSIWKTATSFLKSVWTSFVGGIKAITSAFWNTIKSLWNGAINTIKSVATAFWNRVKTGMSNMWDAVKNAFSSAGNFIKGIFLSFVNNIKERFQSLMDKLKTAKNIVANAFQSMVDKAKEKFRNMLLAIQMKVIEIITKMQELKDKIIEKITSIDLKSIGENMMIGLAAGIIDKIPLVGNAAADAVRSAANRAEQEGQIQSPSRVFMKIGAFLSEGMALGIQKDIPKIEGSISEISAKIEEWKKNDYQKQIDDLKADGELSEAMKMEAERTKENLDIQLQAATERIDKFKSDMGSIQGIFQEAFGMRKDLQGGIVTEIVNAKEELKEIEKSLAEEKTKEEQDQEKIASLQAEYDAKKMFLEKHNQDVVDLSAMIQKEEMKRSLDSIDLLKFEMKEKLQVMKSGLKEQVKMFFDVFSEVEKTKKGKALKKGTNTFASLFMSLGGGFSMPNIPAFANGVNNFGGGVAMVGERGRELVTLPRGSSVVPNKQTENIMNSNNKNVTFNITQKSGESGKEMADYIMLKLRSL